MGISYMNSPSDISIKVQNYATGDIHTIERVNPTIAQRSLGEFSSPQLVLQRTNYILLY
jgi:hypothetical protein